MPVGKKWPLHEPPLLLVLLLENARSIALTPFSLLATGLCTLH
jgi:hypothetical protein